MEIQPKQPPSPGPADWFTGAVSIDPIARGDAPSTLGVSAVRFEPGARTAWHSHSHGQVLFVTEGEGLAQSRGEAIIAIRAGDVVRTPADEWHWHGATPHAVMTHLSITEGRPTWGDHVTDAEYGGGAEAS
jgi:quercetin dioxygenase-like cupin family protein